MSSGFDQDPHSERGHPCPHNRFGIIDYQQLQPIETVFALKRARQLETLGVTGPFNSAHLRAIHKHLFQDVFPWAGEFRVVNISEGNSVFGPALHIAAALTDTLAKLKAGSFLSRLTAPAFIFGPPSSPARSTPSTPSARATVAPSATSSAGSPTSSSAPCPLGKSNIDDLRRLADSNC